MKSLKNANTHAWLETGYEDANEAYHSKPAPARLETLLLNLREVADKDRSVIPDRTRVEPYVGQVPGIEKREHRKDLGGFIGRLSNAFGGDREKILAFIREEKARRQANG